LNGSVPKDIGGRPHLLRLEIKALGVRLVRVAND